MSHLRAPAARADRREGGRHGRPVVRPAPASAETHIRPQLLRLAVLPPTAVALSACAVVLFTVRSTGVRPGATLWAVLAGAVAVTGAGIVIAAVAADRAARSVSDRVAALRRAGARGEADLRAVVEALRRGEVPPRRTSRRGPPGDADDFELLAADLARAHDGAVTAVVQAAQLSSQAGSEQKLEVFVNLARRLQSLVHREISILDELENSIEDPDLLKGLFHVDHLATRIRRHAENLAVLGGAVSRRQWSNPVSMTEVLRSAIAEVEQYARVKLVPPVDGELRGHAVADVIHLLAELVENATVFSAPHTQVLLRANLVTSGLAVEVEDRGLGMPVEEQSRMNALLADPDQVNVGRLLADGRIGLFVVSQLARRHGIRVRLQNNIYGGVQAVLVVPQALLGSAPGIAGAAPHGPDTDGAGLPLVPAASPAPAEPARPPLPPAPRSRPARTPDPASSPGPRHTADAGRATTGLAHPQDTPGTRGSSAPPPGRDTDGAGRSFGPARARERGGATPAGPPEPWDVTGAGPTPARDTPGSGAPLVAAPGQGRPSGSEPARVAAPDGPGLGAAPAAPIPQPGAPAPLPVRGARAERPNPAEAVPGIRRGDRPVVEEHAGIAPTPRVGTVRGTMGKPQLPRRRAQEHIVPQLRGGPAPRQDSEQPAGHDPNLMAAFQRGIGLAEAQQSLEADVLDPAPSRPPAPLDVLLDPAAHPASGHDRRPGEHRAVGGEASGHGADQGRLVPLPVRADARPPQPSRIPQAHPAPAAAPSEAYGAGDGSNLPGPDRSTARHDGSAPAG
ncbi:signal transduction histidine kinase [Streptomyces sp. 3330]|uniref:sensor histidine kinase n=1 Tax=Streptomyces sp. 3330 TaxID=2817755 RepID=UPI002859FAA2|nr:ATP-binding protein [Streptomyces sp. 3330]MDR6980283.1 signal transduction histidine kinase [Streptomyces sp. 3330]